MNIQQFIEYKKYLKPGQALMMIHNGNEIVAKLMWRREKDDKKCYKFLGKIEDFPEIAVPVINKPWATPPLKGKKSFYKFGAILPKYGKKKDNPEAEKIKRWTMAFEALKALDFKPKVSKWVDTFLKFTYDVETIQGISIYYYNGIPRYIECEGEKLIIEQLKPELSTEIFSSIDEVK